jgi:hypothetical protein
MKTLISILFAALAACLFTGCNSTQSTAALNATGQSAHLGRDLPSLASVTFQPGVPVRIEGIESITIAQPDFRQWQMVRREPGAIENIITSVAPAAVVGTAAYLGIREQGRTSRANTATNAEMEIARWDGLAGAIASGPQAPAIDPGDIIRSTSAATVSGIDAAGRIIGQLPLQQQVQVAPIDLNPTPNP